MRKEGHLEIYDVTLTVKTPLHIGSGATLSKWEYAYNGKDKTIRILDMPALMNLLVDKKLVDKYQQCVLQEAYGGMQRFITDSQLTAEEIERITASKYEVKNKSSSDRFTSNISSFMRMPDGRPYIPGSSLKGALRTCLLTYLQDDNANYSEFLETKKGSYDKKILKKCDDFLSVEVFNTLNMNPEKKESAVNSVMRTISISDSEPIGLDSLTICNKQDISTDGNVSNKANVRLLRECVRPGTEIKFKLSIDTSIKGGLTIEDVKEAMKNFYDFYNSHYYKHFTLPVNAAKNPRSSDDPDKSYVILGGGTGFFSKTVVYNLFDDYDAFYYIFEFMNVRFSSHNHHFDKNLGISPRKLKYTYYNGKLMHYGICEFKVE